VNREQIIRQLKAHKPDLQKKYPLANIGLFGSFARNEQTPASDLDIMVEFNGPIGWEIVDLLEELEQIFAGQKIDLVSKGGIRPMLWSYIEKDIIYA
jgi:uncharacterized protein